VRLKKAEGEEKGVCNLPDQVRWGESRRENQSNDLDCLNAGKKAGKEEIGSTTTIKGLLGVRGHSPLGRPLGGELLGKKTYMPGGGDSGRRDQAVYGSIASTKWKKKAEEFEKGGEGRDAVRGEH